VIDLLWLVVHATDIFNVSIGFRRQTIEIKTVGNKLDRSSLAYTFTLVYFLANPIKVDASEKYCCCSVTLQRVAMFGSHKRSSLPPERVNQV
jgi:hypothetical protein